MAFRVVTPGELDWKTRPHEPDEAPRHVAELSDLAAFAHTRANVWRFEPGAKGRRHRHPVQEETFVVLSGTLSMYVGDPPERHDVRAGSLIHVEPGTPLQPGTSAITVSVPGATWVWPASVTTTASGSSLSRSHSASPTSSRRPGRSASRHASKRSLWLSPSSSTHISAAW